jgi:hypothetical protein
VVSEFIELRSPFIHLCSTFDAMVLETKPLLTVRNISIFKDLEIWEQKKGDRNDRPSVLRQN